MFPKSNVEQIIENSLDDVFQILGINAIHRKGGVEKEVIVISSITLENLGEFDEKGVLKFEIECKNEDNPELDDEWVFSNGKVAKAIQVLANDGLTTKFLVSFV